MSFAWPDRPVRLVVAVAAGGAELDPPAGPVTFFAVELGLHQHLATVLGISVSQVGVKATTNERMGFPGREEGMCAMAIATVDLPV